MVFSPVPSSAPACLLRRPEVMSWNTWRSRGVRRSYRRWRSSNSARDARASRLRSAARRTASSNASSSTGFSRKSTAPPFIALMPAGTSPWPVTNTIARCGAICVSACCNLMPSTSGIRRSVTAQSTWLSYAASRNSAAEENVTAEIPADFIRRASDFRADSSSSMIATLIGIDLESPAFESVSRGHIRRGRQHKLERRPAPGILNRLQMTAVRLDDRPHDRQTHPHAGGLGGEERVEQARHNFRIDALAGIANRDPQAPRFAATRSQNHFARSIVDGADRIERIIDQVQHGLGKLRPVAEHDRQRRGHINSQINFFLASVRTDDSIDIAENIPNIHRQRLRFATLKQRAQLPNRRDCPRVVAHDVVKRLANLAEVRLLCRQQAPRRARVVEHGAQRLIQLMRQRCGQFAHHRYAGDVTHFRRQPANFRSRTLTLQRTAEHLGNQAQPLNNAWRPGSLAKNRAERDAADDDAANLEWDLNDGLEPNQATPFEILRSLGGQIRLTRQDRKFAGKNFRVQPWQDLADVEPHRIHTHAFAGPLMGDQNL